MNKNSRVLENKLVKITCDNCKSTNIEKVINKSEFLRDDIEQYTCLSCGSLMA